ncbi:hypothetical protein LPH50_00190 [Xylella taiwanensis]|nr:hypothetical protein [Xylella taiwanensis]MCD8456653.1 hypothetical protein [Xylella taiwanensis]MCD8456668.1 hypothetical protein [Xylella taiwanensis]MCD8459060.1 hypothetical protein [Xylella taiwanensis]MCD8459075.1 hypothetical protein [Xylella taiwanensis]MCD8461199.1 hypothetical protein [Xylella taiwanensis]
MTRLLTPYKFWWRRTSRLDKIGFFVEEILPRFAIWFTLALYVCFIFI